jgi:hypothetical protein
LATWIEEYDTMPRQWIGHASLGSLVAVAEAAGEPEILSVISAAQSPRDNVLDLKQTQDILLRASTIAAPIASLSPNLIPHST